MAIYSLVITLTALSVVLSGVVLAAPATRSDATADRSLTPSKASSSSSWTRQESADATHQHRRRRHRRGGVAAGRHQADVDALRRLLFGLRPLQDHDDVDFGGLEVRDVQRGGVGGVAALTRDVVLVPVSSYADGADAPVLSAILTAPRRSPPCPPGEYYHERRCREMWR